MGSFSWLHFSDLHLTPKANFDTRYAREQLLTFLHNETVKQRVNIDTGHDFKRKEWSSSFFR